MNKKQLESSKIVNLSEFEARNKNLFYIYAHKTLDQDVTFYIGKGKDNRCGNVSTRTYWWKNIASKHGYYIEVLAFNLTEKEAFDMEICLINSIGRRNIKTGTLVNLTDGGIGASGKVYSEKEKEIMRKRMLLDDNYKSHGNRGKWFGKVLLGKDNPNFNNRRGRKLVPVVRIDLAGKNPTFYQTSEQAAIDNNVAFTSLWYCVLDKRYQLKGYKFIKTEDYESGNFKIKSGITSRKKVFKLDLINGEILKEYECLNDVIKDGFCKSSVGSACSGRYKTSSGFKWSYTRPKIK